MADITVSTLEILGVVGELTDIPPLLEDDRAKVASACGRVKAAWESPIASAALSKIYTLPEALGEVAKNIPSLIVVMNACATNYINAETDNVSNEQSNAAQFR